jgi:hypothetical protein
VTGLHWRQTGRQNYTAVLRCGGKYTIDRFGTPQRKWVVAFLPGGTADRGRERIECSGSLTDAKAACAEHAAARADSPSNLPERRPACGACGVYLQYRPGRTREQEWCGTWYDHPPIAGGLVGHTASVLLPSQELQALRVKIGVQP